MKTYLGVDVGSVTTKLALLDERHEILASVYLGTQGNPVNMTKQGLEEIRKQMPPEAEISGVATTGSGRYLAGVILGADLMKNEITAHAVAAMHRVPDVQTIFEIGGQDSKIIMIRDKVVVDFGMNSVCAAGTGSFIDHQAERLNIRIEDFGERALRSENPARIAGRCTVFAESDMIHKQQMGYPLDDIIYGLCQSLVRNYLNNVALGKEIQPKLVFQGGVAFNKGIIKAFNEAFHTEVYVPPHNELMGAIGAAILVHEEMEAGENHHKTAFKGFGISQAEFKVSSFICKACPNLCEISQISVDGKALARWGGRCDMWERV
ncbi:MAG: 2-hydroxyglutaryl-CoA dehydratase [Dehalococcoidia bacterium]|nr:2-hydroxyglutaryl-CoA dehydratase [Dehalococcoidia bacterium]